MQRCRRSRAARGASRCHCRIIIGARAAAPAAAPGRCTAFIARDLAGAHVPVAAAPCHASSHSMACAGPHRAPKAGLLMDVPSKGGLLLIRRVNVLKAGSRLVLPLVCVHDQRESCAMPGVMDHDS